MSMQQRNILLYLTFTHAVNYSSKLWSHQGLKSQRGIYQSASALDIFLKGCDQIRASQWADNFHQFKPLGAPSGAPFPRRVTTL